MSDLRLLDTCVVSNYLKPNAKGLYPSMVARVDELITSQGICLSTITIFELMRGLMVLKLQNKGQAKIVRTMLFLKGATEFPADGPVLRLAAELYARGRTSKPSISIDDGDLLIFATALRNERALVTTDSKLARRLGSLGMDDRLELLPLE